MGGIPVIVLVVFLVIWVLTNVLRAQQDDSKTVRRRPGQGLPNRPAAPLDRNTGTDIDRFLAEIDRLRQRGAQQGDESAAAPRPPAPAPPVARPRPQPQPRPQPAQRARPTTLPRTSPAARPTVAAPPPPPPPLRPPDPAPVVTIFQRGAPAGPSTTDLKIGQTTLAALPVGAASPSARKPPPKGSPLEAIEMLLRGRQGVAAAILLGEVLGPPKSRRL
jgi:hypothetical protein